VRLALALLALLLPHVAEAKGCRNDSFEGVPMTVCEVTAGADLRLFLNGPDGNFGSFSAVNSVLATTGETLGFAMNAGMYHRDRTPVGLFVDRGREVSPIVIRKGPGNFGMRPNGVFCIGQRFLVAESRSFADALPECSYATQSGPMLVVGGALHPRFIPDSDSVYIRNGVGVSQDGTRAAFVITGAPVNFHRFARYFRDALGLPDALYFDGSISRLHAPELGRDDGGFAVGPIVGLVVPKG
jgi:uncharacterized protein YigE (DUF2233 family)